MSRLRLLALAQTAIAAACVVLLATTPGSELGHDLPAAVAFAAAFVLLGAFDVWLPMGDSADMTGAVAFAVGLLLSPPAAVAVVVLSRGALAVLKPGTWGLWRLIGDASRQVLVMAGVASLYLVAAKYWAASKYWVIVEGQRPTGSSWQWYALVAVAALLFFAVDFFLLQLRASIRLRSPLWGLLAGNLRLQGWMSGAQVSAAVLCVVIYPVTDMGSWDPFMGSWGLAIVVALLLVMRQAFALLIEVRLAYRSTMEVLARAMEAQDPGRRGHAERVARLATEAGRAMGLHGGELESLNYAALFHDVGRMGHEPVQGIEDAGSSADILANVGFLSGAVPILRVLEAADSLVGSQSEGALVSAYIVARMSDLDDELSSPVEPIGPRFSDTVGCRLYAESRKQVDRAVRRVEALVRSGRLSMEPVGEDVL